MGSTIKNKKKLLCKYIFMNVLRTSCSNEQQLPHQSYEFEYQVSGRSLSSYFACVNSSTVTGGDATAE